jgi:hypothetical protein
MILHCATATVTMLPIDAGSWHAAAFWILLKLLKPNLVKISLFQAKG